MMVKLTKVVQNGVAMPVTKRRMLLIRKDLYLASKLLFRNVEYFSSFERA